MHVNDKAAAAIGFRELVALTAALMAVHALGIDMMLPALPAMAESLGIARANDRQWIVTAYMLSFSVAQLGFGPIADRFGRRPVLIGALAFYAAAAVFAGFANSFAAMIAVRLIQGVGSAGTRVLATSIVRDLYAGRTMARIMSLAFTVFLSVPILAPTLGQFVLYVAPWQAIFAVLAGFGLAVLAWVAWRLPETLDPADRRALALRPILAAVRATLVTRSSIGYAVAAALIFGGIIGFVSSAEQIFADGFGRRDIFPYAFAACAATMGLGSWANSRIVERLGSRLVSHGALLALVATTSLHIAIAATGHDTLWTFVALQAVSLACVTLCTANFGAMAMEEVGHFAGTASSVQGFITGVGGVVGGVAIGQSFAGTTVPLAFGMLVLAAAAVPVVLFAERGRLFGRGRAPAEAGAAAQ